MSGGMIPAPGSAEYERQLALWDQDERPQNYAGIIICTAAPTIAVALRLYAQKTFRKGWGWDDFFIVIAMVIVWAEMIASVLALKHGAGLHQIRAMAQDAKPDGLLYIYTCYWIVSVLWAPGVTFVKLSILVLYHRIFYVGQRWFKIALWANAFYAVSLGIAGTFIFIFQCIPVDYYWRRFLYYYGYPAPKGHCLPQLAHLVTPQVLSTASDLVILLLPVPILCRLRIDLGRKIALLLLFTLGTFTVACGLARIGVIVHVSNVNDVTWKNIGTVTFTVVEAGVGIVCACMPPAVPIYTNMTKNWRSIIEQYSPSRESLDRTITNRKSSIVSFWGKVKGNKTAESPDLTKLEMDTYNEQGNWTSNAETQSNSSERTLTNNQNPTRC